MRIFNWQSINILPERCSWVIRLSLTPSMIARTLSGWSNLPMGKDGHRDRNWSSVGDSNTICNRLWNISSSIWWGKTQSPMSSNGKCRTLLLNNTDLHKFDGYWMESYYQIWPYSSSWKWNMYLNLPLCFDSSVYNLWRYLAHSTAPVQCLL